MTMIRKKILQACIIENETLIVTQANIV